MQQPLFTVIMTTYNAEKFLPRALDSVLAQTLKDFEIIVSNDGSPDRSADIAKEYMARDKRVSLIDLPHSGGPAAPTNAGFRAAKGEFITFLEYDDEWHADRLEKMLKLFRDYPEIGYAGSNAKILNDETGQVTYYHFEPKDLQDEVRKAKIVTGGYFYNWSNMVLRASAVRDVGFLDENLLIGTEYDYFIRFGTKYKFAYVDEVLMTYHVHGNNVSVGSPLKNKKMLRDQEYLLQKYSHIYERMPRLYAERMKDNAQWNILAGSMKRAYSLYLKSILTYPWAWKTYIKFLISLFGRNFYRKLMRV